jgi:23S rRNA pseudouridine1911/1915/1917 synthase
VYTYFGCPAGFLYRPVNRLDKGTSGLMVVAKHSHAQQFLQSELHTDDFIREYLAVCDGEPPQTEGVIDLPIQKEEGRDHPPRRVALGKPARTDYRVIRSGGVGACFACGWTRAAPTRSACTCRPSAAP